MIPFDVIIVFFLASVLLALSPGPDNLFVLTQAAVVGPRAGLTVTLGLCTGLVAHTSAVALGVAVIFQASAVAFTVLKVAGASYLLYLAWQAFSADSNMRSANGKKNVSLGRLYVRGIIMNVTNPKVSLFFLAFLPQFAEPARGSVALQILQLGAVFAFATILVFGSIALFAGTLGNWMAHSDRAQTVMNRIAGGVFAALALKLLATDWR